MGPKLVQSQRILGLLLGILRVSFRAGPVEACGGSCVGRAEWGGGDGNSWAFGDSNEPLDPALPQPQPPLSLLLRPVMG